MTDDAAPEGLTTRQVEWLVAVRRLYARTGAAPTLADLMREMGLKSPTTIRRMLILLARHGLLRELRTPGGYTRFVPAEAGSPRPGPSPAALLAAGRLRELAADLRTRADEMDRLADEMDEGRSREAWIPPKKRRSRRRGDRQDGRGTD